MLITPKSILLVSASTINKCATLVANTIYWQSLNKHLAFVKRVIPIGIVLICVLLNLLNVNCIWTLHAVYLSMCKLLEFAI